jgi:rRNA maturation protein Nop10
MPCVSLMGYQHKGFKLILKEGNQMTFLAECTSCGQVSKCNMGGSRACSNCGKSTLRGICAGCGQPLAEDCDVKECKGLLVHATQSCWSLCWDKY